MRCLEFIQQYYLRIYSGFCQEKKPNNIKADVIWLLLFMALFNYNFACKANCSVQIVQVQGFPEWSSPDRSQTGLFIRHYL